MTGRGASKPQRKLCNLSVNKKLELIRKLEAGATVKSVCEEYGVKKQTVSDIRKAKEKLLTFSKMYNVAEGQESSVGRRQRMRLSKDKNLEEAVTKWYVQQRSCGVKVSGAEIQNAAQKLANDLGIKDFTASAGWLWRFRNRHGLCNKVLHEEARSVPIKDVKPLRQKFNKSFTCCEAKGDDLVSKTIPSEVKLKEIDHTGKSSSFTTSPDKIVTHKTPECTSTEKCFDNEPRKRSLDEDDPEGTQTSQLHKIRIVARDSSESSDLHFPKSKLPEPPKSPNDDTPQSTLPQTPQSNLPEPLNTPNDDNTTYNKVNDDSEVMAIVPPLDKELGANHISFDAFSKYLALQLKQLPQENAISLQMKISNLIAEEQQKVFEKDLALGDPLELNNNLNVLTSTSSCDQVESKRNFSVPDVDFGFFENKACLSGGEAPNLTQSEVILSTKQKFSGDTKKKFVTNSSMLQCKSTENTETLTAQKMTSTNIDHSPNKASQVTAEVSPKDIEIFRLEEVSFEAFGKFVAAQLKEVPLCSAIDLQIQFHNLIGKEIFKYRQEQSSRTIASIVTSTDGLNVFDPDTDNDYWDVVSVKSEAECISSASE